MTLLDLSIREKTSYQRVKGMRKTGFQPALRSIH